MNRNIFFKYHGAGNDFILIDNKLDLNEEIVIRLCDRRLGIGSDGLLHIIQRDNRPFLEYYNRDGKKAKFCGNGLRVAAFHLKNEDLIKMDIGTFKIERINDQIVAEMPKPEVINSSLQLDDHSGSHIRVGVDHFVTTVEKSMSAEEVFSIGKKLRSHPDLGPNGANIHFIWKGYDNIWMMRSFEKGVENITLSCGSGAIAAFVHRELLEENLLSMQFQNQKGMNLGVSYKEGNYFLGGKVKLVFNGRF